MMLGHKLQCTKPYVLIYILLLVEHVCAVFVCAGQLLEKQAGLYMAQQYQLSDRNEINLLATTNVVYAEGKTERERQYAPYPGQLQVRKGTLEGEIVCNVARMCLYPCPFS